MRFSSLQGIAPWIAPALMQLLSSFSSPAALDAQSLTDFHLQWTWSTGGRWIGNAGLEVVDLDGDGRDEIVAASSATSTSGFWYELHREGIELVQTYSSLPREDGLVGLGVAQEGANQRIVVTGTSSITVYDGRTKRELATFPTISSYNQSAAVGDLDGDGILDAVVCDYADLYVYELLTGKAKVKHGFGCRDLAIGQTDDDPQLEIALAGNAAGGFVLDGATLAVDWADVRGFGFRVCLGDFDGDGRDEVASLVPEWQGLRVQDPETGVLLWEMLSGEPSALAAADLDGLPGEELVWAEGPWGAIHVVAGATGDELHTINSAGYPVLTMAIGDTDGDGVREVAWSSESAAALFLAPHDATDFELRTVDWDAPLPGVAVGDFLGNGDREVATASYSSDSGYSGGVALVLSIETGRLLRSAPQVLPSLFGRAVESIAAGQLDADPALEICLAGGTVLACFDGATFAQQWRVELQSPVATLRVGEIDGDPYPELLVGTRDFFVYAFDGENGWMKWRTPDLALWGSGFDRLRLADVEGGPLPEVIAAATGQGEGQLTTFVGSTGLSSAGPWILPLRSLATLPDGGPPVSLLVGRNDGTIAPVDPLTGIEGAVVASFPEGVQAFGFADFNRDGTLDIAALLGNRFSIQDGDSGLTLWVGPFLGQLYGTAESFLVGDLDGDTVPEILVATQYGLALFGAPLFAIFEDGFESGDTSHW